MNVEQVCTLGAVHIPQSLNLREAAIQMRDQHVGTLVVTDDATGNCLVGILTDRDIVLRAAAAGLSPGETAVADVMTQGVMSVDANDDLTTAMEVMATHGVRRLAVTGDGGEVIGVLSLDDVISALGVEWTQLTGILESERQREYTGGAQSPLHL